LTADIFNAFIRRQQRLIISLLTVAGQWKLRYSGVAGSRCPTNHITNFYAAFRRLTLRDFDVVRVRRRRARIDFRGAVRVAAAQSVETVGPPALDSIRGVGYRRPGGVVAGLSDGSPLGNVGVPYRRRQSDGRFPLRTGATLDRSLPCPG